MQTIEQFNFRLEELEKRISTTYKKSNNDNEDYKQQFDNIEKDITSLQTRLENSENNLSMLSTNYNLFCAETNSGIETIELKISNLIIETSNISNDLSEIKSNLENLDVNSINTKINSLTNSLTTVEANIENVNTELVTIKNNIELNSNKITSLENKVAVVEDKCNNIPLETFNFYDKTTIKCGRKTFGSNQNFGTVFFLCEPTSLITLKIKTKFNLSTAAENYNATLQYLLNDNTIIMTQSLSTNGELETNIEFTYEFYPTQKNNRIKLQAVNTETIYTNLVQMETSTIEIWGRNIVILNKDRDFKVYLSKNYYYLTKNYIDSAQYKKLPVGETDINSGYTDFPTLMNPPATGNVTSIWHYNYTYLPYIVYDSTTAKYICDQSDDRFAAANSMNASVFVTQKSKVPLNHNSFTYAAALSDLASFSHPGEGDKIMRNTCSVYHYHNYAIAMSQSKYISGQVSPRIKLNGVNVDKVFVYNTAVFAKDWEDNSTRPYYCIATDEHGDNWFYNGKAATYCLNIGYGYQTNAFMQSDGSINVYVRVLNNIIKKVLTLNEETNMYELTSETNMEKGWEFIEGYYNDYFINKFGTWEYVPQTSNN